MLSSNLSLVFRWGYWRSFEPEDPIQEENYANSLESDGERGIEMFWERESLFYMYSSDELFRTRLQCRIVSSWCCPKALSAAECSLRMITGDHERSFFKT